MKFSRILLGLLAGAAALVLLFGCESVQRKMLYFPTHQAGSNGLAEWRHAGELIGFAREVPSPKAVWLLLHGNGGQAAHRTYALPCFSAADSVFIVEYPGFGLREGAPSMRVFNAAARQAYDLLRRRFPHQPVCVAGESLGSGPASFLTTLPQPPDKVVLLVPFDVLARVAGEHYPFLPVTLLLHDNWNNVSSLAGYRGHIEIFAATDDTVIPIAHARALAASKPQVVFHEIPGGHGAWARDDHVRIRYP